MARKKVEINYSKVKEISDLGLSIKDTFERLLQCVLTRYLFMTIMKEGVCQGNILQRQNHSFHLIGNKMNGNNIQ